MATAPDQVTPSRTRLVARPKADADMKAIRAETTEQYAKTLEYLGR